MVYPETRNPGELRGKLRIVTRESISLYLDVRAILPTSAQKRKILNDEDATPASGDVDGMVTLIDKQLDAVEQVLADITNLTMKEDWPDKQAGV